MSISLQEFQDRLNDSGLLSSAKVQVLIQSMNQPAETADALARELVRKRMLTEYQAKQVYRGNTQMLVIDEYQLMDQIGSGGMGQVFKAWHRRLGRAVALKLLPEDSFDSPQAVRRFRREVLASAQLDHPNIVSAHNAGDVNGRQYFVMQFVDGRNLNQLVSDGGPFSVHKALDCVLQTARGLQHAHERGVIHRDIKPGNLLLSTDGVLKILDLGLARFRQGSEPQNLADDGSCDSTRLTLPGQMLGTAEFAPPEQARDTRDADERSDIYSLGCTLYFLLHASPPFVGESVVAILIGHAQGAIPSICDNRSDAPPELDAIFKRMMAKEPANRFQSVAEIIPLLEALLLDATDVVPNNAYRPDPAKHKTMVSSDANTQNYPKAETIGAVSKSDTKELSDDEAESTDDFVVAMAEPATFQEADDERDDLIVARWTLTQGGQITYQIADAMRRATSMDDLPDDDFLVESVSLDFVSQLRDDDMLRLKPLRRLRRLLFHGTPITDNGVKHLRGLRSLELLSIGKTKVTDVGLAFLVTLNKLNDLSLSDNAISDRGLDVLARMRQLRRLVLTNTKATPQGLKNLQARLPDCEIIS